MQTPITDYDFYKSASNLNLSHLRSTIYENIHGLASILGCVDMLRLSDRAKGQAKKLINKPQCKLWIGYEKELLFYIHEHLWFWFGKNYSSTINYENYKILLHVLGCCCTKIPGWISDELIQTHRSVLIQKEIKNIYDYDFYTYGEKFCKKEKCNECDGADYNGDPIGYGCCGRDNFIQEKYKTFIHYRNLWPDCPTNLKMHYGWRKEK
jgi:hypothetical protein